MSWCSVANLPFHLHLQGSLELLEHPLTLAWRYFANLPSCTFTSQGLLVAELGAVDPCLALCCNPPLATATHRGGQSAQLGAAWERLSGIVAALLDSCREGVEARGKAGAATAEGDGDDEEEEEEGEAGV